MDGLESHPIPDSVDPQEWVLEVSGLVDESLALRRDGLVSLPLETFTGDFECVQGWCAPDLSWRGVRMETILARAGASAESGYALVRAMDGDYACSFPLDRFSEAVLAIELDGDPLPREHGGPARLVPTGADADCWESVKWVSEIEIQRERPVAADTARETALSRTESESR